MLLALPPPNFWIKRDFWNKQRTIESHGFSSKIWRWRCRQFPYSSTLKVLLIGNGEGTNDGIFGTNEDNRRKNESPGFGSEIRRWSLLGKCISESKNMETKKYANTYKCVPYLWIVNIYRGIVIKISNNVSPIWPNMANN